MTSDPALVLCISDNDKISTLVWEMWASLCDARRPDDTQRGSEILDQHIEHNLGCKISHPVSMAGNVAMMEFYQTKLHFQSAEHKLAFLLRHG